jgi:hypothetical protein
MQIVGSVVDMEMQITREFPSAQCMPAELVRTVFSPLTATGQILLAHRS